MGFRGEDSAVREEDWGFRGDLVLAFLDFWGGVWALVRRLSGFRGALGFRGEGSAVREEDLGFRGDAFVGRVGVGRLSIGLSWRGFRAFAVRASGFGGEAFGGEFRALVERFLGFRGRI